MGGTFGTSAGGGRQAGGLSIPTGFERLTLAVNTERMLWVAHQGFDQDSTAVVNVVISPVVTLTICSCCRATVYPYRLSAIHITFTYRRAVKKLMLMHFQREKRAREGVHDNLIFREFNCFCCTPPPEESSLLCFEFDSRLWQCSNENPPSDKLRF